MSATAIGKFQVVGQLGTGAHSTILHIRRSADGKNYALKVVPIDGPEDQKFLEQAQHEYRVAQLLDHPSLIKVYTLETVKDWWFRVRKVHLLIEYVNGKTLDTCPRITVPRLVQIFQRVADGLCQMHRRGVYHADLKPGNIMVSRTGDVKVIDYGLAWVKGEDKGRIQGTLEYMAPEQIKKSIVDEATDIFNLGATMYRMVTWRTPPSSASAEDGGVVLDYKSWNRVFKRVQEFNPMAPPKLCELIHRCMAYKREERPERMTQVRDQLAALADELVRSPEDSL